MKYPAPEYLGYSLLLLAAPRTQIRLGGSHTCAVLPDGRLVCWGDGTSGAIGSGNTSPIGDNETPASAGAVKIGGAVAQVATGVSHTCALMTTGDVKCFGQAIEGQLGYVNTAMIGDNETPDKAGTVSIGGRAIAIGLGLQDTCALLSDGKVRCWGSNSSGQLGLGLTTSSRIGDDESPGSVSAIDFAGSLVSSIYAGGQHVCAQLSDRRNRCWGANSAGQLGIIGTFSANYGDNVPAAESTISLNVPINSIDQMCLGQNHTCALVSGRVSCWGQGTQGQLGTGFSTGIGDAAAATSVNLGVSALAITCGNNHNCALVEGGFVKCWGDGSSGQLGYGTTLFGTDSSLGNEQSEMPPANLPISGVASIAAGGQHTCAVFNDGSIKCWGQNGQGQLGYGNTQTLGDNESINAYGFVQLP